MYAESLRAAQIAGSTLVATALKVALWSGATFQPFQKVRMCFLHRAERWLLSTIAEKEIFYGTQ